MIYLDVEIWRGKIFGVCEKVNKKIVQSRETLFCGAKIDNRNLPWINFAACFWILNEKNISTKKNELQKEALDRQNVHLCAHEWGFEPKPKYISYLVPALAFLITPMLVAV